jgi:KUP system potassium uptake protein
VSEVVAREEADPQGHRSGPTALGLLALGVVFGDIGTSPIYAIREAFHVSHGLPPTPSNVLGVLSLIVWSLIIVISIKYIGLVMRADNGGEGGIIALTALVHPPESVATGAKKVLVLTGLFGAALLYGDSMITPAISVLSAVEGMEVVTTAFAPLVVPLTLVILIGLFAFQSRGTEKIGRVFGPIMLAWFSILAVLGVVQIFQHPYVLWAVSPHHAIEFIVANRGVSLLVLGSVFLVVTGGEAVYADMGHFGVGPIRRAWFAIVLPALVLNYFGQGAVILENPAAVESPFFLLVPDWGVLPLVLFSTVATVIASQAVISGAFSLTRQAVQLGYLPRLRVLHTSSSEAGQIYLPAVNWALMVACVLLVVGFGSSSRLAGAYGVAVTTDMVFTTVLFGVVAVTRWGWRLPRVALLLAVLLVVDLSFWIGNLHKIVEGGWVPLVVALVMFTLMTTWQRGRRILGDILGRSRLPTDDLIADIRRTTPVRVPGTAVFLDSTSTGTPTALLHNLKHNHALHERVVFLTVEISAGPYVQEQDRVTHTSLGEGIHRLIVRYGFAETPDLPSVLARSPIDGAQFRPMETTYFVGSETIISTPRRSMARWRERLFVVMARNATRATRYFGIPAGRVVEMGMQVEI